MPHTCHAKRCMTPVSRRMLMCLRHWKMVPKSLQRDVWDTYSPGQERGAATPTPEWHEAANAAIDYVLEIESEGN